MLFDRVPLPPLPPQPALLPVIVRIAPGERWCTKCFETVDTDGGYCMRCGSRQTIPAVQVLRRDEYTVAA